MRTFKEESIWCYEFYSFEEAESKIIWFVDFYNDMYPHSKLNYLSPVKFENQIKLDKKEKEKTDNPEIESLNKQLKKVA